jgi:deoxyribonuclease V
MNNKKYVQEGFYAGKEKIGVAIRLQEGKAPVFISAGNKISLTTAIDVIKMLTTDFKFPDNMRRADQASRATS